MPSLPDHRKLLRAPPSPPAVAPPPLTLGSEDAQVIIILTALIGVLICLFSLAFVIRYMWLRGHANRSALQKTKGIENELLRTLPKTIFSSSSSLSSPDHLRDCPICLADFSDGEEVRILPRCGHGFHVQCIDTWLSSHTSCPSCRWDIFVVDSAPVLRGAEAETGAKEREDLAGSSV